MTVYSIRVDTNTYQWIMPIVDEEQLLDLLSFNCRPRLEKWPKVEWYIYNPVQEKGNFFTLGVNGVLAFDEDVYRSDLFTLLEMSGEIIPITVGTEQLFLLNVLECVNMLNEEDSHWDIYEDGTKGRILNYSFYLNRFSESSLFKIPQTCKSEILTYSGVKEPKDEFKTLYEQLGFSGLVFEELFLL